MILLCFYCGYQISHSKRLSTTISPKFSSRSNVQQIIHKAYTSNCRISNPVLIWWRNVQQFPYFLKWVVIVVWEINQSFGKCWWQCTVRWTFWMQRTFCSWRMLLLLVLCTERLSAHVSRMRASDKAKILQAAAFGGGSFHCSSIQAKLYNVTASQRIVIKIDSFPPFCMQLSIWNAVLEIYLFTRCKLVEDFLISKVLLIFLYFLL